RNLAGRRQGCEQIAQLVAGHALDELGAVEPAQAVETYVEGALQLVDLAAHVAAVVAGERAIEAVLPFDQEDEPAPAELDVVAREKLHPGRNGCGAPARRSALQTVAILDAAPPLPSRDDGLDDALL